MPKMRDFVAKSATKMPKTPDFVAKVG